jgi:hypothetical protein
LSRKLDRLAGCCVVNDPQAREALAAIGDDFEAKAGVVEAEAAAEGCSGAAST